MTLTQWLCLIYFIIGSFGGWIVIYLLIKQFFGDSDGTML